EARERVRAAIRNSGLSFPLRRVTVSLAPAVLRKEGPAYDLPIAVGVLRASAQLPPEPLAGAVFLGELALGGALRHRPGLLPLGPPPARTGAARLAWSTSATSAARRRSSARSRSRPPAATTC